MKDRFFSFSMVIAVGFLLLVSLVVSAGVTALGSQLAGDAAVSWLWQGLQLVVSLGIATMLFALVFTIVPDVKIDWRHVWPGALATAVLFTLGRYLIGLYLGRAAVGSSYGAAGSLIAVLVWVYYSAQILFFGAELTQAYAASRGAPLRPSKHAVTIKPPEPGSATAVASSRT